MTVAEVQPAGVAFQHYAGNSIADALPGAAAETLHMPTPFLVMVEGLVPEPCL